MDVPTIVVKPGEGRSVWLGGMGVVFKVSGSDTGAAFAVVEHPIEPGRLVLPHVHLHEDEYSSTSWRGRSARGSATTRSSRGRAVTCSSPAG
jgi:hypothetical protein